MSLKEFIAEQATKQADPVIAKLVKAYIKSDGKSEDGVAIVAAMVKKGVIPDDEAHVERGSLEWANGPKGFLHVYSHDNWFQVNKDGSVERT